MVLAQGITLYDDLRKDLSLFLMWTKKTLSRREHIFRFLAGGKIKAQIVFGVTVANESLRNVKKKKLLKS